jgi:hypothetical protein
MAAVRKKKEIYLTPEPHWKVLQTATTPEAQDDAFKKADFFVHYEIENKAKSAAMRTWIKRSSGWPKEAQQQLLSLPEWFFCHTGKYAWIAGKLGFMAPSYDKYLKALLPEWLNKSADILKNKESDPEITDAPTAPVVEQRVVSIQDRMAEQVSGLCGMWEEKLDQLLSGKASINKFEPYSDMRGYEGGIIKANHAKIIKDIFAAQYQEAVAVKEWTDEDLKEAYIHFDIKMRKMFLEFFEKINTACDTYITTGKAQRKTRKPKAIKKEKVVSKLKYQINESELGIASINPIEIIDAKELWIYNTKTRKLGVYKADDIGPGLSVKGSGILNYMESQSVQKTLRKPKDQIKDFRGTARTKYAKSFDSIKSTETKLNGRLNAQTILLKAF